MKKEPDINTNSAKSTPDELSRKVAETAIRIGVLTLLLFWCFQIVQPFIATIVWGAIIAVAIHPVYRALVDLLRGRRRLAATLLSFGFLVLLLVPTVVLTKLLVENVTTLAEGFHRGQIIIPPPPEGVKDWPVIGDLVARIWSLASTNLSEALKPLQPQIKALGLWLVNVAASAGIGLIMFIFAFIIAGVFLTYSAGSHRLAHGISKRLVGERGDDFANLAEATIRSVARGVLGVAVIQALLAGLGFMVAGVPGAGIWTLLCLISAVVQVGVGPIVIPAIIYVFATGNTLTAVAFLVWGVLIMVLDNVLKPLLMGRGIDVPMLVIFLGAVGGMLLSGIVGLFVGAIVLALGYKLFQTWLNVELST
ncbi:MAG: AI-2E family transporter [Desulfobulbaceae bacterium]|jgi:predicted PurR-regulated permease PerM|nr:AI-2E family transporter [Desulfobulbaceae bacterium]